MEKITMLKKLLLAYSAHLEHFESVQSNYDSVLTLYRRRKRRNLMVLHQLRKKQLLCLEILQQTANQRSLWKLNRRSQFWETNCNRNDDHFFKEHFRMSRSSFDILCGLLNRMKRADTNWRKAITLEKRVAIALFTLGTSIKYREISELFGVGISTVCEILFEFCEEVWKSMSNFINKLPPKKEDLACYIDGFCKLGFPQCMGVIDGYHIKVKPNPSQANGYLNNEGWHSIILLALVDYRCRFLYVNIGAQGQYNNAQTYNSSTLRDLLNSDGLLIQSTKEIDGVQVPVYIIGDSTFDFSPTLMTPYASSPSLTENQKQFNNKLLVCTEIVNNAFRHLKARFRRIEIGIDDRKGNAQIITRITCILHNFLNEINDDVEQKWLELLQISTNHDSPTNILVECGNEPYAEEIRHTLCHYVCGI
uniref:Putative nuclease HARBI1 n=2 Tax=Zeugodacus cucurbitae TaxID=28588 RepID=A0A0A1X2C0_ZEUCU